MLMDFAFANEPWSASVSANNRKRGLPFQTQLHKETAPARGSDWSRFWISASGGDGTLDNCVTGPFVPAHFTTLILNIFQILETNDAVGNTFIRWAFRTGRILTEEEYRCTDCQ
jgi:hypothetical protein